MRNGTWGCNKPTYKLDHNVPQKWSKPKKKMIIKLVKTTPDSTWNMPVVDNKWLGVKPSNKAND